MDNDGYKEEMKNEIILEVKNRSDTEGYEYLLYKIQQDCEAVAYQLIQNVDKSNPLICILQVRENKQAPETDNKSLNNCDTISRNPGYKSSLKFCSICFESCRTNSELRKHLYTQHKKLEAGFVCELCGKTFSDYNLFWKHKSVHSNFKPYECELCKKSFKTKRQIRRHLKVHHLFKEAKFVCEICKKSFTTENNYTTHMQSHTGDLNFQCNLCGKKFSSRTGLSIHNSHKRNCVRRCNECGKVFHSETGCVHLKNKKIQDQKAKYVPRGLRKKTKSCPVCGKMFLFNSEVKLHVTVSHTEEKKFVCEECGKCFKTQKCFQLHKRIHIDFRPYLCRFCDKRFRTLNHIKQHIRTHTGEKPYSCPVCGRGFAQNGDMKKHLLKIHDFVYDQIKS